jgi:O-antigen/teichoic acid export membrane protein
MENIPRLRKIKSFVKNTAYTFFAGIIQLVLGLISSVILARVLGPNDRGVFALASLFPVLLITITNLGIGPATAYFVAQKKYTIGEVLGTNFLLSIVLGTASILIGTGIILSLHQFLFPTVEKFLLFIALAIVPFNLVTQHTGISILLGAQLIKKYNLAQIVQTTATVIFIVIFLILFRMGVAGALLGTVLASILVSILIFGWLKAETQIHDLKLSSVYLRDLIKYGLQTNLGNIVGFLNYRVEIFIMGALLPTSAVGFYSIASGLAEKLWLVSHSASTVLFPVVSSEKDEDELKSFTPLVSRNIFFITVLSATILFIASEWLIVFLYSTEYISSVLLFRILLPGIVFVSISRILANDIAGRGKPIINSYIGGIGLILQIVLNVLLIPVYGAVGSAIATSLTYLVILVIRIIIYVRLSGNHILSLLILHRDDLTLYRRLLILIKQRFHLSMPAQPEL